MDEMNGVKTTDICQSHYMRDLWLLSQIIAINFAVSKKGFIKN
jgi:hypothetical protein